MIADRIAGRPIIASVSGGKDSTAMCLHLIEQGMDFKPVFLDTGWEHPTTYTYLRDVLPGVLGRPIHWLRAEIRLTDEQQAAVDRVGLDTPMVRLIVKKGMFPSRVRRFCTQETKVFPMRDYLDNLGVDVVNTVGIRADESASRAKMAEWEESDWFDGETWRPILRWSFADVVAIHARHGVTPNPLYLDGAERVGCWPCIFARKAEIAALGEDTDRVALMAQLEAEVVSMARARHLRNGKPDEDFHPPSWFQSRDDGRITRQGVRTRVAAQPCWPIARVLEWARTGKGGRQFELFAAGPRETGCMRWGLCDTGGNE